MCYALTLGFNRNWIWMFLRIQVAFPDGHKSTIMIAKKSNVHHSLQIGGHCLCRPVWKSLQFRPNKYVRPGTYFNEPIRFAGVGIVIALVARIYVINLLLANFEHSLCECE